MELQSHVRPPRESLDVSGVNEKFLIKIDVIVIVLVLTQSAVNLLVASTISPSGGGSVLTHTYDIITHL